MAKLDETYLRQYPVIGLAGQATLQRSRVLVVGAGGIGCAVLPYLAAAGIATLGVVDNDTVSRSNLHRQVLYGPLDVDKRKVDVVKQRFALQFPGIQLETVAMRLTAGNAKGLFNTFDLIIDGSDNFTTRYLVNDIACQVRKPFVSASVLDGEWQVAFFNGESPCYRCLYPTAPPALYSPNCSQAGVLGPLVGMAGQFAAHLAIDHLVGTPPVPTGTVFRYTHEGYHLARLPFTTIPNCTACVQQQVLPVTEPVPGAVPMVNVAAVGRNFVWLDVREPWEQAVAPVDNAETLPLSQLLQQHLKTLNPQTPYALLCKTDVRSQKAYHFLKAKGFDQLIVIEGGASAWYQHHGKTLGY